MTWFKVDDNLWSHPKTIGLSHRAMALWVRAGAYAACHLTDGVVSRQALGILQGTAEDASELVHAGLWLDHVEGYLFHDWHDYQPTRSKVQAERAKTKERVTAWRERAKSQEIEEGPDPSRPVPSRPVLRVTNAVTNAVSNGVTKNADPDPFDAFWSVYPRKISKAAARKSWSVAIRDTDPAEIISAASKYAKVPGRSLEFTAHPTTWLNQRRWEDEYPEPVHVPEGWLLRPDGIMVDGAGRLWDKDGCAL